MKKNSNKNSVKVNVSKKAAKIVTRAFGEITGTVRTSVNGRDLGTRIAFMDEPISETRKKLQAQGVSGSEARRLINAAIAKGAAGKAWLNAEAGLAILKAKKFSASHLDVNAKETSAVMRFYAPVAEPVKAVKATRKATKADVISLQKEIAKVEKKGALKKAA